MRILNARGGTSFWQWDTGRKIVIIGDEDICGEAHFCTGSGDPFPVTIRMEDSQRVADVPDEVLQNAKPFTVYLYRRDGSGGATRYSQRFAVHPRTKPTDYIYTPTERKTWEELDERITALEKGGTGNGSGGNSGNTPNGEDGATFTPAVSEDGTLSWSNDKGLENPAPVNIKGPQGEVGPAGNDGNPGKDGLDGQPGKDGVSITHSWNGTVLSVTSESGTSSADLKGEPGQPGEPGKDGYTPVKGVDYFDGKDGQNGKDGKDGSPGADGLPGADGQPGKDGTSPVVSVSPITGGHRITITDKNGTKTVDVMDGRDGQPGEPGKDGEDGQNHYFIAAEYGATGDGVTDDAPALNALVTAVHEAGGGTIYLPKGVYMLDSPILWQSNVSLRGEGMGLAILKPRQAAGVGEGFAAIRGLAFSADDPYANCTFEQFTIDGEEMQITEYTSWPKGINIHFMSNCVFRDIEIRNTCATGLGVDHLRNSVVDHVICINCGRSWTGNGTEQNVGGAGIGIGSNCMEGESLIVQNCVADGCGNYGILFEKQGYTYPGKPEGHVIANNVVRNGRNHGIVVKGDSNVVVSGNVVFGNANDGLAVLENNGFVTEHIMFSNNLVRGNGNGFRLESDGICRDITLSGNVFDGNGIVLNTDTTELSLIGNTIKNSATAVTVQGIHADAVVRNNIFYKNTVGESTYGTFTGDISQNDLVSAWADLSAYTRLEYIQSSGTQYINTGFKPDSNTRVIAKTANDYALDVLAYTICGTRTASKNKEFDLRCSSQFYWGSSMVNTGVSHSGTVDFNKNALRANGALVGTAPAEAFECEYPLYIFALNGAGTALSNTMAVMRLYYLNIFDGDTMVRAMLPVRRKSDGAVGLVDALTGEFYENSGSGSFTGA